MSLRRMRRVPLYFILTLCALVSCERKNPAARATEPSPSPASPAPIQSIAATSAQPSQTPTGDFPQVAQSIRPAVIIVSVFDETGHLSANGHGFFLSDDGKFIADRSVIAGGVNAVAKAADGAIYNVSGALGQTPGQNLVLLKADATRTLPFLTPSARALPEIRGKVAVVLSPVERANSAVLEEKISGRFSDEAGEWLDVTPALPKTTAGAPVIDQRGEVIGIVTFRAASNSCAIRPAAIAGTLLAQVSSNGIASWQNLMTSSNLMAPTASPTATRSPTPAKIPLRGSKLIYAPAPRYPAEARQSRGGGQSSGSFRVLFDTNGHAVAVQTLRSTGNSSLDQAAVNALHEWRSEPGREWSLVVPITFKQ
jgi:TonB family protein